MLYSHTRRAQFLITVAAAGALATTGCGGHAGSALPQTPTQHRGAARTAADVTTASSLFVPNSVKYSDTGSHPVTGRSGSAVVQSRALLAKDGTTLVEATTGTLDGAAGAGNVAHVTMTATTFNGSTQTTNAYNNLNSGGYWSHGYSGLARNEALRIDTNITDLDPRTDVVTTNDIVKLRPDLAATSLTGPAKAYRNHLVSFTGTVKELNGDVGARADCVLLVDGTQVDQAPAIWVDAAGSVNCAFETLFATLGAHTVTVSASNVVPSDWDLSNNSAETTIEIVDPVVHLTTRGYASTESWKYGWSDSYSGPVWNEGTASGYNGQASSVDIESYTYDQGVQFPISAFSVSLLADGNPIALPALGVFIPWNGECENDPGPGTNAQVCSYGSETDASANFYGEAVTYYSTYYTCMYASCHSSNYISNYRQGQQFALNLGSSDVFAISFTDAAGTQFTGQTAAASPQIYSYSNPYNYCYNYWLDPYDSETYCENQTDTRSGVTVNGYGQ